MRIGLLTHQWPGTRLGGIGAYTLHAARGLARAGHEVHLFTLTLPADVRTAAKLPPNVYVHEVTGLGQRVMDGTLPPAFGAAVQMGGDALHRLALASLLCEEALRVHRQTPLDLIEGPEYESLTLPLAGVADVPTVTQLHSGSAIAREVGNLLASREQSLRELLELAAIEGADAICAPSRQVITDTRVAYAREDIATHAAVLPLPFDVGGGSGRADGVSGRAGGVSGRAGGVSGRVGGVSGGAGGVSGRAEALRSRAALYVGRIEWLKGSHLLARAANIFLLRHREATLRLAGPDTMTAPEPSGTSMVEWMKRELVPEVRERVVFLWEQTREQIGVELAGCAFFVAPSLRESYSYVCCEALAAGRAAVVSDQTGAAEVVGEAGVVFARGDVGALAEAMSGLWEDEARCARLGALALERARTVLSGEAVIAKRVAFYEGAVAAFARGATPHANACTTSHAEAGTTSAGTTSASTTSVTSAGAARLGKVERVAWIRKVVGAMGARDAAGLMELVNEWGAVKTPGMWVVEVLERHAAERGAARGSPGAAKTQAVAGDRGAGVRFYLYGAGRHTAKLLAEKSLWEARGHVLVGLIDDHPRFKDVPEAFGLPVESCAAAAGRLGAGDAVILSTDAFEEQFWQQALPLRERGVGVWRLYGVNAGAALK